jgi:hypothetical protein
MHNIARGRNENTGIPFPEYITRGGAGDGGHHTCSKHPMESEPVAAAKKVPAAAPKKAGVKRKSEADSDAASPVKQPKPVKLSVRAANEEYEPSPSDKGKFWAAVSEERLDEVAAFCAGHPKLLKWWMEGTESLYAGVPGFGDCDGCVGPLAKYVGLGKAPYKASPLDAPSPGFAGLGMDNRGFRAGSMAVLFAAGMDVPDGCMDGFLQRLFGSALQGHPVIGRLMPAINKRLADAAKGAPAMLERLLHAAAVNTNLHAFQAFAPASKGKGTTLFDVRPDARPDAGTTSVLQAVLRWPDPKIRHELASMVLARSSTAYVMRPCLPMSALEQAALLPDPEMLTMIIIRLQADGVMAQYMDAIGTAACKAIQQAVSTPTAPPALQAAYAAVQTKLASLLDEQHLTRLRGHLDTLRENAIRCKLAASVTHPLHAQATAVIDMLAKVTAGCVAAVTMCAQLDWHMMEQNAVATKAEEALFTDRYQGHLKQIHFDTDTQQVNAQLVAHNKVLEEQLEQQRRDLQVVKTQAETIARLRRALAKGEVEVAAAAAAAAAFVPAPAAAAAFVPAPAAAEAAVEAAVEAAAAAAFVPAAAAEPCLQLPVPTASASLAANVQAELAQKEAELVEFLEHMDTRLLRLRLPIAPSAGARVYSAPAPTAIAIPLPANQRS